MKSVPQMWSILFQFLIAAVVISCSPARFESRSTGSADPVPLDLDFNWFIAGEWSSCSRPCDSGVQTREVKCQREDQVSVDSSYCSGEAPASVQSCNVTACTTAATWNLSDWSSCSRSCGGGVQSRSVVCQTSSGSPANESTCSSPKPDTSRSCNDDTCPTPVTYAWSTSSWGACNRDCAGGLQNRIVECRGSDGSIVADSSCSGLKPQGSQACNTQACAADYTYAWDSGDWTACSVTCGGGYQIRSVYCERNDGAAAAEVLCPSSSRPAWSQACNTQACTITTRDVSTTAISNPAESQVDILLVVDDSTSMLQDNTKLGNRLNSFVSALGATGINWQMCVTTTRVTYYEGRSIIWAGTTNHIMNASTANRATVFANTMTGIGADWVDSGDEQGIKAMSMHLNRRTLSGCYRDRAALAVIVISDEDERSVGGNQSLDPAQYRALDSSNQPSNYVAAVAAAFNTVDFTKPLSVNSIIVKPGDSQCKASQDAQGTPSYYGVKYKELSNLTQGFVGSICDADYSSNLNYFKEVIYESLPKVVLECNPIGTPQITITPNFTTTATVIGNEMQFNPVLPPGSSVTVNYKCPL